MKKLRTVFFGTPELSSDIMNDLLESSLLDIVAVVSNPDTNGGRGHSLLRSPVAQLATEKNILLLQPEKVKNNDDFLVSIRELQPDIALVVAYGKILPQALLDIPTMGFLNVHTSLLPKYRWAAPIQHALLNGEKKTGLTIMQMSLGMDEWDILVQENWKIIPTDTTGSLFQKTGERGGHLLLEGIKKLLDWTMCPTKQNDEEATYTKYINKTDGQIQPDWSVDHAYHAWQAYTPWPGLYTFLGETKVTLHSVEILSISHSHLPLSWHVHNWQPALALSNDYLIVHSLTPSGKKMVSGEDFVRGYLKDHCEI